MRKAILAIAAVAGLSAPVFAQTGTLDQQAPMTNASYNLSASSLTWQQQVRVGVAGHWKALN